MDHTSDHNQNDLNRKIGTETDGISRLCKGRPAGNEIRYVSASGVCYHHGIDPGNQPGKSDGQGYDHNVLHIPERPSGNGPYVPLFNRTIRTETPLRVSCEDRIYTETIEKHHTKRSFRLLRICTFDLNDLPC